jgi:2-C-methyl-D-erythritol 2,4-cyclodiphosphate synthase/2-C-methyl-D-erythritol 4-phosphate cytidylyltransferase
MAGTVEDKVLAPLFGNTCAFALCLAAFVESGCPSRIVVTFRDAAQKEKLRAIAAKVAPGLDVLIVPGGAERRDSVLNALETIPEEDNAELVFVHDSARPLVTAQDIRALDAAAKAHGAASLAHAVTDTIKSVANGGAVPALTDLPREKLRAMETPQVFPVGKLREGYRLAVAKNLPTTDDAAAAALAGIHPVLLAPSGPNGKLTGPDDFETVNRVLSRRASPSMNSCPFRTGIGYDIHRFAENRPLVLGGVTIPHARGLDGHSDADCLCHAIADAILGAAGLPDIGYFFPPGKAETKGMDSLLIVKGAVEKAREKGLAVGNIDATLIAKEPKIAPHIPAMKERLAAVLGIPQERIGIKATTNEGIGGLGRGEGIAATASALLYAASET